MSPEVERNVGPLSPDPGRAGLNRLIANNDIAFAIGLAAVLATLLIPLPTFVLDVLLSCSIAVALATLVMVLSATESIELPAFPSLLLLVTLFRLSLNVASTRLILLHGDAGRIIYTFGNFVAGGSLVGREVEYVDNGGMSQGQVESADIRQDGVYVTINGIEISSDLIRKIL